MNHDLAGRLKKLEILLGPTGGDDPAADPAADFEANLRAKAERMTPEQRQVGREALAARPGAWAEVVTWLKAAIADDPSAGDVRDWVPPAMSAYECLAAGFFPEEGADEPNATSAA